MNVDDQQIAFETDLNNLIDRYISEFDLTLASAIGVLETVKLDLYLRHYNDPEFGK